MSAAVAREWQRFTPAQRLARFAVLLAVVAAVGVSLRHVEVIPEFLLDAPEQVRALQQRFTALHDELRRDTPRLAADAIAQVLAG